MTDLLKVLAQTLADEAVTALTDNDASLKQEYIGELVFQFQSALEARVA